MACRPRVPAAELPGLCVPRSLPVGVGLGWAAREGLGEADWVGGGARVGGGAEGSDRVRQAGPPLFRTFPATSDDINVNLLCR